MHTVILALVASAAMAAGQATLDPSTGRFSCALPNGTYCAGNSLATNIIIRCTNGTGFAGNCNDNLAGVPPVGVKSFAPCWQTSSTSGDAACSFNGIVYGNNGTFPVPGSSPSASGQPSASATPSATGSGSGSGSGYGSASATPSASSTGAASASAPPTTVVTTTTTPGATPVTLTTTAATTAATTSKGSTTGTGTGNISLAQGAGTAAREVSGWLVGLMGVVAWAL